MANEKSIRVKLLGYTGKTYQILGDRTCVFNALSEYVQCSVNPLGNCQTCLEYQRRNIDNV